MSQETCHPLFGGITLAEARRIHREATDVHWARKNLWHVEVTSPVAILPAIPSIDVFNLYCIGMDYSPITLTGEKRKIGAAVADILSGTDPIELRITTLDDTDGTLSSWFEALSDLAAPVDGTVNVPARFATRFKIRRAFVDGVRGKFEQALFRPGAIEISLARSESAMQELTMSFIQLDTFMPSSFMPIS
ncbi:MAG: hypothetical protein EOM21_20225 [Gammaproteobacteria bacterium]|nr:hypothetical protein [Gammaproteobacteria bacterium]